MLANGLGAGPLSTDPSAIRYPLWWHGHLMRPLSILLTAQPWWVHTVENAFTSPAVGWVTTTFCASKNFPPPTGMSVSGPRTPPAAAVGVSPAPPVSPEPPSLPESSPQAASATVAESPAAPASTLRRVGSVMVAPHACLG